MQLRMNDGFTLIELVVVIVILGILAASAAPKFINLSSDARIASLKSAHGSIKSSLQLFHYKTIRDSVINSIPNFNVLKYSISL